MIEVELSDGTILEVPDDTSDEAIRNYAERAEAKLRGGAPPASAKGPETWEEKQARAKREAPSIVPDMVKRAVVQGATGLYDLPATLINMGADYAGKGAGSFRLPIAGNAIMEALGIPQQAPDATYPERIAENAIGIVTSPVSGTRNLATGAIPYAQRAAGTVGDWISGLFPNAARVTTSAPAKVAGVTAAATGGVVGEDIGREYGGDLGGIVGAMAGGFTPAAVNAVTSVPVRGTLAKSGGASAQALTDLESAGISPRPGLVGNRSMARIENTAAGVPIIGQVTQNRQQENFNQFNDAFYGTTAGFGRTVGANEGPTGTYGPTQAPTPESADTIGARIRNAARVGEQNLKQEYSRQYDELERGIPTFTLVDPLNTRGAAQDLANPYTGEGASIGGRANEVIEEHIDPAVRTHGSYSEYGPVVTDSGIPFQVARPTRTSMRYEGEGQAPMGEGAHAQMGQAFTQDMERALYSSPEMIRAYPDPMERQSIIERYRTIDREYRQDQDPTLSRSVPPSMPDGTPIPSGGGAFSALEEMQNPPTERGALAAGMDPGRLAVLQRTNPEAYPPIAGDIMVQKTQAATPLGDVTIEPSKLKWWAALGPNEKLIFANNRPELVEQMDTLARVGNLFHQRQFTENRSNTSPMTTTIGAGVGLAAAPAATIGTGLALTAASLGVSSDTLARYLGRTNPQMLELLLRKGVDAGVLAGMAANRDEVNSPPITGLPLGFGLNPAY